MIVSDIIAEKLASHVLAMSKCLLDIQMWLESENDVRGILKAKILARMIGLPPWNSNAFVVHVFSNAKGYILENNEFYRVCPHTFNFSLG